MMKYYLLGIFLFSIITFPILVFAQAGQQGSSCTTTTDCVPGYSCNTQIGQCTKTCNYWTYQDQNCTSIGSDYVCDALNNYCVAYSGPSCTDADNGNAYVSGSSTYSSRTGGYVSSGSTPDQCINVTVFQNGQPQGYLNVNSCTQADIAAGRCYVQESTCSGTQQVYNNIKCTNGCSAGACTVTCSDGLRNQDETGIDCGGPTCSNDCYNGDTCSSNSDCQSGFCIDNLCVDQCHNIVRDPNEDGVDCGGTCPLQCPQANISFIAKKGPNDPGDHDWYTNESKNNVMVQLNLTALGGSLTVTAITLKASGTGNDLTELNRVLVVIDEDRDGKYDAGEVVLTRGVYNVDNGDLVTRNFDPPIEIEANRSEYVLIVYEMKEPASGKTFTINVFSVLASDSRGNTYNWVENGQQIRNTKTVRAPVSCNPWFDTAYNQYRGCYPNDPFANPNCPCPLPTPDLCQEPCTEGDLVCDGESLYLCLSGILTPLNDPEAYAERCSQDVCSPGSTWCNLQDRSVVQCQEDRRLGSPFQSEQTFGQFCENRLCQPGESYCVREGSPDAVYFSCENGVMVPGTQQQATDICQARECNPGQINCDHSSRTSYECEEGRWAPLGESAFPSALIVAADQDYMYNQYCGNDIPPLTDLCDVGEKRCNFETEKIELCQEDAWVQHPQATQEDYKSMCSGKVCNENWFYCDPIDRKISFCGAGQWGQPNQEQYAQYCEPAGLVPAGNTTGGVIYSEGTERVIVGELRNNTVIKIVKVPAFPSPSPALKEAAKCPAAVKEPGKDLTDVPWWLVIIIIIIEAVPLVYFYKKYYGLKYPKSEKIQIKKPQAKK